MRLILWRALALLCVAIGVGGPLPALAQKKPNILVISGDDVGQTNLSVYGRGVVG